MNAISVILYSMYLQYISSDARDETTVVTVHVSLFITISYCCVIVVVQCCVWARLRQGRCVSVPMS